MGEADRSNESGYQGSIWQSQGHNGRWFWGTGADRRKPNPNVGGRSVDDGKDRRIGGRHSGRYQDEVSLLRVEIERARRSFEGIDRAIAGMDLGVVNGRTS